MKTVVCRFDQLVNGQAKQFIIGGRTIAIVRIDESAYAISDKCSHADVELSAGEVICETKEIECVRHGSSFSLVTGEPNSLPATKGVAVFVASVENGDVVIEISL